MSTREQSHQQMVDQIVTKQFGTNPNSIDRIAKGICNEVYKVSLPDQEIIARLSSDDSFLKGSSQNIPLLQSLGIKVPEILFEDYSRTDIPLAYQLQTKIEGQDIGNVIHALTDEQLTAIAGEVANVFTKLAPVPTDGKFGNFPPNSGSIETSTWTERMQGRIETTIARGEKTGVMDSEMKELLLRIFDGNKDYFNSIPSVLYFSDIGSNNVMIAEGKFTGLVDLDSLSRGDFLEAVGKIELSWFGTHYGEVYSEAVMSALNLNSEQRNKVIMYSLIHAISWACENGIQFNLNTRAEVNREQEAHDKQRIAKIAELYNNF